MKPLYKYFLGLSLLLFSCSKDSINTPEGEDNLSYGSLNFSINKETAPPEVSKIIVILSRPEHEDISGTMELTSSSTAFLQLKSVPSGVWYVNVDAYNIFDTIIYSGEANVNVIENEVVNLNIVLNPVTGKLGIISLTIKWGLGNIYEKWEDYGIIINVGTYQQVNGALQPSVIYDEGKYKMWYTGMNPANKNYIFYATSTDGIDWNTRHELALSPTSGWDNYSVGHPQVIKVGPTYFMYYRGSLETGGIWSIGVATSLDGITWEKKPEPVIYGDAIHSQVVPSEVLYVNNKFYLYFTSSWNFRTSGATQVYLATSSDGFSFEYSDNPVITKSLSWEDTGIYSISIIHENNSFKMIYNDYPSCKNIGYAESNDGRTWLKRPTPFFTAENLLNNWSLAIVNLELIKTLREYRIYYGGLITNGYTYKIGLLKQTQ